MYDFVYLAQFFTIGGNILNKYIVIACDCEVQHTFLYYDEGQILEHCTLCKKGGGCVVLTTQLAVV